MDARRQNDGLSHSDVDWVGQEVGDDKHVDIIAGERLAKNSLADLIFVLVCAHLVDKVALIGIGEGVAVGKENSVVIVLKDDFECEGVVDWPVAIKVVLTAWCTCCRRS